MHKILLAQLASVLPQSLTASIHGAVLMGIVLFMVVVGVAVIALIVFMVITMWTLFKKAGRPGWTALIPFYNTAVLLELSACPLWWIVLFFVPIVNIFILVYMNRRLALQFGKQSKWFVAGMTLLPFIFLPILAFGKSTYAPTLPLPKPMTEVTKWALIAAGVYVMMEIVMNLIPALVTRVHEPLHMIGTSQSGYAADDRYVYYYDVPVSGADLRSFTLIGSYYAKDDEQVYYDGVVVSGADPDSFSELGDGYGKDATNVYNLGIRIEGADPASFQVLDYGYSKDKNNVYYSDGTTNQVVPGADPATFTVESYDSQNSYDASDKSHHYSEGQVTK